MKKLEKISITAIASLAVLGTTVFGATGKVYNTSQGLVLRKEASKSAEPLATIANDAEVEIIEKTGEWYKVNANGKEGYLFAEYVEVQEESEEEPTENTEQPVTNNQETPENTTKTETKIYIVPVITSSVIGTIPENTKLNVEKTLNNWSYVSYGETKGWIRTASYNTVEVTEKPQKEAPEVVPEEIPVETPEEPQEQENEQVEETPTENTNLSFTKGYINSESVNVRKGPSTDTDIVTILILNTGVTITAQTDEWYKVTYGDYTGYIYKPLISETPVATSRGNETREPQEVAPEESSKPVETPQVSEPTASSNGSNIVSYAKQYLGYSYVYGGTTPGGGFDCSGFVYYVFNSCGYNISRSLSVQANTGTAVSRANLQIGDVLFFDNGSNGSLGHVGIYIGDGRFIHAANPRRGVVTDTINSGYYNTYYHSARRIAN